MIEGEQPSPETIALLAKTGMTIAEMRKIEREVRKLELKIVKLEERFDAVAKYAVDNFSSDEIYDLCMIMPSGFHRSELRALLFSRISHNEKIAGRYGYLCGPRLPK
jgi:hypothetical protein